MHTRSLYRLPASAARAVGGERRLGRVSPQPNGGHPCAHVVEWMQCIPTIPSHTKKSRDKIFKQVMALGKSLNRVRSLAPPLHSHAHPTVAVHPPPPPPDRRRRHALAIPAVKPQQRVGKKRKKPKPNERETSNNTHRI
jgi:hypothetical protein